MSSSLERRIAQLECSAGAGGDVEWARAVCRAYQIVRDHPEQIIDEDRALAAATSHEEWSYALGIVIGAAGGLAAVVRASYEIGLSGNEMISAT